MLEIIISALILISGFIAMIIYCIISERGKYKARKGCFGKEKYLKRGKK